MFRLPKRKPKSVDRRFLHGRDDRPIHVSADRGGWECARCGGFNPGNPLHCQCGAHRGLAAID